MKPVIYLAGDIIYKASTDSDCMYFIASGTVVLITFSGREVRDCTCLREKNELLFRLKLQLSNKMFLRYVTYTMVIILAKLVWFIRIGVERNLLSLWKYASYFACIVVISSVFLPEARNFIIAWSISRENVRRKLRN